MTDTAAVPSSPSAAPSSATAPARAIPTLDDIRAAAGRLSGQAVRTPLLSFPVLDAAVGARVFVKPECLQRTGSFKFRGAYNAVSRLSAEARRRGVVASSSGNHAQGLAEAARLYGVPATIVMPSDAPAIKRARTEALGARIVPYNRATDDRDALARAVAAETGATIIHPYEHPDVIAGQGTIGLEVAEDLAALGVTAERLFVPTGGGGLTGGVTLAVTALMPGTAMTGVEPSEFEDHARSAAAGARIRNERLAGSICDALLAPMPGELSFAINASRVDAWTSVSDAEALAAVAFAARELKLVAEPGGAVALAAVLAGRLVRPGDVVVVVISGGNVDPDVLAKALAA